MLALLHTNSSYEAVAGVSPFGDEAPCRAGEASAEGDVERLAGEDKHISTNHDVLQEVRQEKDSTRYSDDASAGDWANVSHDTSSSDRYIVEF